jgi:uroporphyrinogen-III synthase
MNRVHLLVTRPQPECERTAAELRSRGHEVTVVPLLRIEAVAQAHLGAGPWAAVLFTSANAVRAIGHNRRFKELAALPAYVVGARTRAAAEAAGFAAVTSADGDVDDLMSLILAQPPAPNLPLLYLAGSDRAGDLAEALQPHGLQVETAVVYRSVMVADLRPDVRAALAAGRIDAVLHYSARTAEAFLAAATTPGLTDTSTRIRHLCLSAQVAAPLLAAGAQAVEVASEPNELALFECIRRP